MHVSVKKAQVEIDLAAYKYMFENSIYYDHPDYKKSLSDKRITMSELVRLSREASLNYTLFFAPYETVKNMIDRENERIYQGFGGNFTVSLRGHIFNLNLLRMIIKDIKIKQSFIARHMSTTKNPHLRFLAKSKRPVNDQAQFILSALKIDMDRLRSQKNKLAAMWYLIDLLEDQNIFVSIEAQTNMPQNLRHVDNVAGVYIKDSRYPYLFICNEGQANFGDGAGRKIFTIFYLLVCMFKGRSRLVTLSDKVQESEDQLIYEIVETILMPLEVLNDRKECTVENIDELSENLKVTSRALLVRLRHLSLIEPDNYKALMALLRARYEHYLKQQKELRDSDKKRYKINIANNIIAYHGKAYLKILKNLYLNGKVTQRQINLHLSYGKQEVDTAKVFDRVRSKVFNILSIIW